MKWTKEQSQAIRQHGKDVLVSAAAGSGKTAVLVERILSRVTDPGHPTDIDRLLVVTFTKAAAGEMKERIGRALEQRLLEGGGDTVADHMLAGKRFGNQPGSIAAEDRDQDRDDR